MPQVTCPQCGAVNGTEAPDYPFCAGCQDNLAKCGYCRWFDSDLVVCTNREVAGVFEVAADATPPCDQHRPKDSIMVPGRSLWPVVAVGLVALLVLVYSVYELRKPLAIPADRPGKSLHLEVVNHSKKAVVGHPYMVAIEITNMADETIGGIRLQISKESVPTRFRLAKMTPEYSSREDAQEWCSYIYPDLAPKETRTITLELIPHQPGSYQVAVRLVSRGTTFHGMTHLPVQVAAAPEQGIGGTGP